MDLQDSGSAGWRVTVWNGTEGNGSKILPSRRGARNKEWEVRGDYDFRGARSIPVQEVWG